MGSYADRDERTVAARPPGPDDLLLSVDDGLGLDGLQQRHKQSWLERSPLTERGTIAGMIITVVGALGPATWAAAPKTTTALHAENRSARPCP
jgi:hypothetical protein